MDVGGGSQTEGTQDRWDYGGTPRPWGPPQGMPYGWSRRGWNHGATQALWPGGLTLRLQVAEQWLGVVQSAGGEAAHAVLSQAAGRAQQWVPVLGCAIRTGDGSARGPDQGQGHDSLHRALWEGETSKGSPRRCESQPLFGPLSLHGPERGVGKRAYGAPGCAQQRKPTGRCSQASVLNSTRTA